MVQAQSLEAFSSLYCLAELSELKSSGEKSLIINSIQKQKQNKKNEITKVL